MLTGPETAREAAERYAEAAELFADAGMPAHRARALALAGFRLAETGRTARAAALLDQAYGLAQWCGWRELVERIARQRTLLSAPAPGRTPRRVRGRGGPDGAGRGC
ncbi:hypothetical protein NKH77_47220 [Streptomyces sp. M19]